MRKKKKLEYKYSNVKILKIIDGDTIDVEIDFGFSIIAKDRLRILNLDTPELRGKDKDRKKFGQAAKQRAKELLPVGEIVQMVTIKGKGKYGRYLAEIMLPDGRMYSDVMIEEGYRKSDFENYMKKINLSELQIVDD